MQFNFSTFLLFLPLSQLHFRYGFLLLCPGWHFCYCRKHLLFLATASIEVRKPIEWGALFQSAWDVLKKFLLSLLGFLLLSSGCVFVCVCMWWHGLLCSINTHWPVCAMKVSSSWTNQEMWTELAGQLEIIYCGSAAFRVTSLSSSQMDQKLKNSLFEIFYGFL